MAEIFRQVASEGEDIVLLAQSRKYNAGAPVELFRVKGDTQQLLVGQAQRTQGGDSRVKGSFTIADPGTAKAIPVTNDGYIKLVIGAGVETNTLADPSYEGQTLSICADTIGAGSRAITAAHGVNQTGNTVMTFGASRDWIKLEAITVAGSLRWTILANDGVALS
jgi:hypothetical protein